jgi:hypothetical protein
MCLVLAVLAGASTRAARAQGITLGPEIDPTPPGDVSRTWAPDVFHHGDGLVVVGTHWYQSIQLVGPDLAPLGPVRAMPAGPYEYGLYRPILAVGDTTYLVRTTTGLVRHALADDAVLDAIPYVGNVSRAASRGDDYLFVDRGRLSYWPAGAPAADIRLAPVAASRCNALACGPDDCACVSTDGSVLRVDVSAAPTETTALPPSVDSTSVFRLAAGWAARTPGPTSTALSFYDDAWHLLSSATFDEISAIDCRGGGCTLLGPTGAFARASPSGEEVVGMIPVAEGSAPILLACGEVACFVATSDETDRVTFAAVSPITGEPVPFPTDLWRGATPQYLVDLAVVAGRPWLSFEEGTRSEPVRYLVPVRDAPATARMLPDALAGNGHIVGSDDHLLAVGVRSGLFDHDGTYLGEVDLAPCDTERGIVSTGTGWDVQCQMSDGSLVYFEMGETGSSRRFERTLRPGAGSCGSCAEVADRRLGVSHDSAMSTMAAAIFTVDDPTSRPLTAHSDCSVAYPWVISGGGRHLNLSLSGGTLAASVFEAGGIEHCASDRLELSGVQAFGGGPQAVFDGASFLVAWETLVAPTSERARVWLMRVGLDGSLLDADPLPVSEAFAIRGALRLASDGRGHSWIAYERSIDDAPYFTERTRVREITTVGAVGAACSDVVECAAGHCVDGICCDRPCDGTCDACAVANGAAVDGVCASVCEDAGTAPDAGAADASADDASPHDAAAQDASDSETAQAGCGCRVGGRDASPSVVGACWIALGLAARTTRRRAAAASDRARTERQWPLSRAEAVRDTATTKA